MTILKLESFTGEIPRLPAHLLPDHGAVEAVNCNFSHGELRALQGPGIVKPTSQAVRSLFSDDGLRFFTWSKPTWARLGPTIDDTFNRVYFANEEGFRVTQTTFMKPATAGPVKPAQSWLVGLPRPARPMVNLIDTLSDSLVVSLYREAGGAVVGPVTVTHTEVVQPGREYLLHYQVENNSGNKEKVIESVDLVFIDGIVLPPSIDSNTGNESSITGSYVYIGQNCSIRYQTSNQSVANIGNIGGAGRAGYVVTPLERPINSGRPYISNYSAAFIIKNGHEYSASSFYALLQSGQLYSGTESSSVLDGGSWLSTESKLIAKVASPDWFVFSGGSVQEGNNAKVFVSLEQEGEGVARVKISHGEKTSVAYSITFVNQWNEESQASEPVLVELDGLQSPRLTVSYQGFADGVPIKGMNVYRTYGNSDAYLLINANPLPTPYIFLDQSTGPETSTLLNTAEWEPPRTGLKNIAYVGNGFMAGALGKDLYFSEPYHPHAWPYAMTFPHAIVGLEAVEGGVLVTTLGKPYMVYGTHPEQMTQQMVDADQAGISDRSLTRVEGNAVFASHDGLVTVSGGQASLASSQQLFTRKDWRERYHSVLQRLVLGAHDGAIVALVDPGSSPPKEMDHNGFLIRLDEEGGTYTRLKLPETSLGCSIVPEVDGLFLGFLGGFAEFGVGDFLEFSWRSKDFTFPQPVSFGAVVVDCSPGLTIGFYCDQQLVYTHTVGTGESRFRLPAIPPQKTWAVKFTGTGVLRKFEMASSFGELKNA